MVGCIGLPECASEHDETVAFRHALEADVRVASILMHKPDKGIYVEADSRAVIICINVRGSITVVKDGYRRTTERLGNVYTQEEIAAIEDAAADIRMTLDIKRAVLLYDGLTTHEHKVRKSRITRAHFSAGDK